MCVCLSAIINATITCAKLLCHYALQAQWKLLEVCRLNRPRYVKVRQARLVLCCLDGERVVGNDDNSV